MKITDIRVEQFGALQDLELTGLAPGLNVVLVPHGSAATTLVRFLRRMLFGLDDAPWACRESAGRMGAVTVDDCGESYRLVRSDRAGHPETFAICVRGSEPARTETLRATLAAADRRLIEHVCFVTAEDRDRPDELRALAGLLPPPTFGGRAARQMESCTDRESMTSLAQRCEQVRLEISARTRSESRRQQEFDAQIRRIDAQGRGIAENVSWLDAELQAAVVDLREAEDRQWMPQAEPQPADRPPTDSATDEIGSYAEHLRRVICDLAERRLKLSQMLATGAAGVASANDAGFPGERSHTIRVENERMRIDRCEAELMHQLRCLQHARADDAGQSAGAGQTRPVPHPDRDEQRPRERLEALRTRCRELRRQLDAARGRQCELQSERRRLDAERRRSAADRTLDAQLYDLSVLEQQSATEELERQATVLLHGECQRLHAPREIAAFVRERASTILMRLTGETSCGLEDATKQAADTSSDECRPVAWLGGGSREQAALALRLALLSAASRSGGELPVVWDDALTESDPEQILTAGRLLAEFAQHGPQIILATGRAQVAALLAECGATVHQPVWTGAHAIESEGATHHTSLDSACEPDPAAAPLMRIHPADPHWLRADSSLNDLPSLGPQMARQLRRMGLMDIGDLIALDLAKCPFLLSESRLTAEQMRLWQAEAELLCCVPDLTGRDAQLLVNCGLLTPEELAAANPDELAVRIDRLRGGDATRWLPYVGVWPRAETVRSWIHAARRARPLVEVIASAARAGRPLRRWPSRLEREAARIAGMIPEGAPAPERPARADVRLRPDSPVVDAPSIGPKTARLLERIGIMSIGSLLTCDAEATARRLHHPRITAEVLTTWQRQAALMCSIPGLRCGDAQVLVACGIHQPADLRRISASALSAIVGPYVESAEGRRVLRSAAPPTADDVARWVAAAQDEGVSRAA